MAIVLDSYALLAYFRGEPEGAQVVAVLEKAGKNERNLHMTEVNYAEVKYMILRKDGAQAWQKAAAMLPMLPVEFHAATRDLADTAADFKAANKLSLADAFAAAPASRLKATLMTGDPEFKALEGAIKIEWL
jgi:ribonuclease VapC